MKFLAIILTAITLCSALELRKRNTPCPTDFKREPVKLNEVKTVFFVNYYYLYV
jgi:hypothetical protein